QSHLLLFLFDAPPPAEVYALSLHDALPILAAGENSEVTVRRGLVLVRPRLAGDVEEMLGEPSRRGVIADQQGGFGLLLDGLHGGDRKSTRLNSSHVKISYAVFCLKKKKKQQ